MTVKGKAYLPNLKPLMTPTQERNQRHYEQFARRVYVNVTDEELTELDLFTSELRRAWLANHPDVIKNYGRSTAMRELIRRRAGLPSLVQ